MKVSLGANQYSTVTERYSQMSSTRSAKRGVQKSRVEAGSNTFTVAQRAVGGDKKGSLELETVK
jgi:hypothetical protein